MANRLTEAARGVFTIAATPFDERGGLDLASTDNMIDFYLGHHVHGITILGMMGEAPKLSYEESVDFTARVLKRVDGRVPVIVGVSNPGLGALAALAHRSMELGAAGVMVAPSGQIRTDEQLHGYFAQVFRALGPDVPVCYQDFPPVTGVWTSIPVLLRLIADFPQLVMFKHEDNPSLKKLSRLRADSDAQKLRRVSVLVGSGGVYYVNELARGADGAMTGYAFPEMLVEVGERMARGDREGADDLFEAHLPLIILELQPGIGLAVRKEVLYRRGAIRCPALRAPGPVLDAIDKAEIDHILKRLARRTGRATAAAAQ